jgi:DNA-binding NarL/FixJ family response regulator
MIRVMLVEDHALMRRTLRDIISSEPDLLVVAEASDGQAAIDRCLAARPDVILMDIDLPECSGIAATRHVIEWQPEARVVMLTVSSAEEDLFESLRAGACGYITKDARREEITGAIRAACQGALPLTVPMANRVLTHFRLSGPAFDCPAAELLTSREQEILHLLARGLRDKEIAYRLSISPATVKKHVEHILQKLQVRTRAEATARLHLGPGSATRPPM